MKKFILIFLCLIIVPAYSFSATGEEFKVNGYNVQVSASKLSDCLVVRCQIKGGKSTDRLYINFNMVDSLGRTVNVKYIFKNYSYSDKFSIKKPLKNGGNRWKVSAIKILN